ncbi:MAG: TRAP transporter small permease subunit [Desulfobulbaceae bacterium]|nr:TRAP transporter small permease subunit [Desulfobulbaceae bacterium]HIJ91296.1 TRAP transporter small permease subunit [Deltaproteobacteria bacterium]
MMGLGTWLSGSFQLISRLLERLEEAVLLLLLAAMIVLACAQIVLRDVWGGGLSWADPLLRVMVLWAGLLGAVVATKMDKHISIDLTSHLLPKSIFCWLRVVRHVFATGVCVILAWQAVVFVRQEALQSGGQEIAGIASWQLNLIFPIAFAAIALRFLIRGVRSVIVAFGKGAVSS